MHISPLSLQIQGGEPVLPASLMECFEFHRLTEMERQASRVEHDTLLRFVQALNRLRGERDARPALQDIFDPLLYVWDHPAFFTAPGTAISLPQTNSALYRRAPADSMFRLIAEEEIAAIQLLTATWQNPEIAALSAIAAACYADTGPDPEDREECLLYVALNGSARLEHCWAIHGDVLWDEAVPRTVLMPDITAQLKSRLLASGWRRHALCEADLVCYTEPEAKLFGFDVASFLMSGKTKHLMLCSWCRERVSHWHEQISAAEAALSSDRPSA